MKRARITSEAGNALVTTLIVTASVAPLGAFALMQARLDLLLQHNTRDALELFYVAESGLEHALADLARDPVFDRLLAGPDGRAGTADDREFPFQAPPPPVFPSAPLRYQVEVEPRSPGLVDIIARGFGNGTAAHAVAASVRQSAVPFVPAAVYSAAERVTVALNEGIGISGFDRSGQQDPQPALALATDAATDALRTGLDPVAAAQLRGAGGTPSIGTVSFPAVETLAAAFAGDPSARVIGPAIEGPIGSGATVCPGSLEVGNAEGDGVLIVHGNLQVTGQFSFSGVLFVLGDVIFDRGSDVHIVGSILQGSGRGQLHGLGIGTVAYDSQVVQQLDLQFPGRLPRRALVSGWRELS